MEMMVVGFLVLVTATNIVLATMGNNGNLGNIGATNIAIIIATAMAHSGGVVLGNTINDFGYGTKFGTQPGKVIMILNIYLVIIMIGDLVMMMIIMIITAVGC